MHWNIKGKLSKKSQEDRLEEIIEVLLANREIDKAALTDFLNPPLPTRERLFQLLVDLDQEQLSGAVEYIKAIIQKNKPIIIYGDYDCDGVCASAILYSTLKELGADVAVFIPHRVNHGYGLSTKGLEDALKAKENPLVITVDNGISAVDAVKLLRSQNIDIIITDHHQLPPNLPEANFIVHTTLLSGSGIAWLLGSILLNRRLSLELASLATVCDLLPLTGLNRSLVKHGLSQLHSTKHPGLNALFEMNGLDPKTISTYHLGFILGPRINAVGRLGHAKDALSLLTTNDPVHASVTAYLLSTVNQDRQFLTSNAAKNAIEYFSSLDPLPKVIFYADKHLHEGIIGLIASKLVDHFHRPAVVATLSPSVGKASARSVPGLDITEFLKKGQQHFLSVGGHHQAAGLSFNPQNLKKIQSFLSEQSETIDDSLLVKKLDIDIELVPEDLTMNLLSSLERLAPFGMGNEEPVFSVTLPISSTKLLGKNQAHLKILAKYPFNGLDIIAFNQGRLSNQISLNSTIKLAFNFQKNVFRDKISPQLLVKDIILSPLL